MAETGTDASAAPDGVKTPAAPRQRHAAADAAAALLLYALYRGLAGLLALPAAAVPAAVLAAFALSALAAVGLPIAGISALVRASRSLRSALCAALSGLALWLGLGLAGRTFPPSIWPLLAAAQDVGKILASAGLGVALAAGIREVNILLPAGIFAAFADFVVVNFGTVKHALSPGNARGQALVKAFSATVPSVHPSIPVLTIGSADFLFLGVFLACAYRFGMPLTRTAVVLAVVLAASLVMVPYVGNIPALAPISAAFIATNWRHFRLSRQELASTVVVLALVGVLFAGYFLLVYPSRR